MATLKQPRFLTAIERQRVFLKANPSKLVPTHAEIMQFNRAHRSWDFFQGHAALLAKWPEYRETTPAELQAPDRIEEIPLESDEPADWPVFGDEDEL
jgi:hypothetical protein